MDDVSLTKNCCRCGRVGTRGFHEVLWGADQGRHRCTAAIACDKRVWRKTGKPAGWRW